MKSPVEQAHKIFHNRTGVSFEFLNLGIVIVIIPEYVLILFLEEILTLLAFISIQFAFELFHFL